MVATGVNADGHREILGIQVATTESGAGWLAFFRDLVARGLTGVALGHLRRAHRPGRRRSPRTLPGASLATLPHPLRREPDVGDPEVGVAGGSRRCCTPCTTSPTPTSVHAQFDKLLDALSRQVPARRRRPPRRRPRRRPRLHRLPPRDLAPDLVQQPQRTPQPRDPPPHRRRRHLPRPRRRSSASSAPSWPNNTTNGLKRPRFVAASF